MDTSETPKSENDMNDVEPDEDATDTRRMDGELRTLGQILRLLNDMEPPARARVVAYLSSRFQETRP